MQLPTLQHLCLPPPPLPLHCSNRERTPSPPPPPTPSVAQIHHLHPYQPSITRIVSGGGSLAINPSLPPNPPSLKTQMEGFFLPQGHHITLFASSVAGNASGGGFLVLVNFFVYK